MSASLRTAARIAAVALTAAFAVVLSSAGAASAATCTPISDFLTPPSNAPLPGSCFEGWDGDQVDSDAPAPGDPEPPAPNRLDWGSAAVTSAAQKALDYVQGAADSQFTGGSEENPDSWTWNVGSLGSDKYNMISGYSYQEPGTQDLMLNLAFVRESNNGTSWLAFELNQKQPGYRSQPLLNAVPPKSLAVPTRSTGDLLITYSVSNNNSPKPVVGLCKWVGDEHSGVWTNMSGVPVASNCPTLSPSVAQADMNGADIPAAQNHLGSPAGLLEKGTFGEASVNLTEAFKAAGANPNSEDDCLSFGYFWAHSRSSEPVTSAQQDFILPTDAISAANCAVEGTKWHDKNGNGLLDGTDEELGGWTIFADYDDDGVLDPGEPSDVTAPRDANDLRPKGTYTLTGLVDGTYEIREVAQPGWNCTSPSPCSTEVTMTGAVIGGVDFLNFDVDPAIELTKTNVLNAAGAPKAGDTITYSFEIENTGNVALTGVDLDDDKLGYADFTCTTTSLAVGAKTDCTGDHTLTQADIDAGSVKNEADACGDPAGGGAEVCSPDDTTTTLAADPKIELVKTGVLNSAGAPKAGDTITYTFEITNKGNVTLDGVDLDDDLLGLTDVVCNAVTVLAPTASTTCTKTYTLTQADIDAGKVDNEADACGDSPKDVEVCDDDTTTTPLAANKGIQLKKTGVLTSAGAPKPGDEITYSFEITNTGNVTLTGVDLDDAMVAYSDATCDKTVLAPGAVAGCSADYTLTQADIDAGSVTNVADACGDSPAPVTEVCDDDTTTTPLAPSPSIVLEKTAVLKAAGASPVAGDKVTYGFEITNSGNVTLDGVDLDDALVGYDDATCDKTVLAPGAKATCSADYTLTQADIDAGKVDNEADACGDSPKDVEVCDDDDTSTPLPAGPKIALKKTAVLNTPVNPKAGDKVTYSFEIANTGNVTLTGSDLDDALVGFANAACGAATLAPGAKATCTADYTLTQDDVDAGTVTNTATACADAPSGTEVCDDDTTTTPLEPNKGILVEKDGPATVYHGDQATYTFLVSNTGSVTLSGVKVTDDKCAPVQGPVEFVKGDTDAKLEVGEQWRFTCTTTIGAHADGEANPIVNTVTATGTDPKGGSHTDTDTHETKVLHAAVQIDKSGPAGAEAGTRVQYALVVTNPGDTALVGEKVGVTDAKCDSMPVLNAKKRGAGDDPTPGTLDPGDSWVYTCFVQTALGEQSVVNVASVVADDVNARRVSDDDDVTTPLTQPQIQVLPETVVSGAANLRGPAKCVNKAFIAKVTGKRIKSVTWYVDGKKVKTFRSKTGEATRANYRVRPDRYGQGVHRLKARVTFAAAARTNARTLRMTFQECAKQIIAPKFTG